MTTIKRKTAELLKYIEQRADMDQKARQVRYDTIVSKYGLRGVHHKLRELADKGYIDYAGKSFAGKLTPKGVEFLRQIESGEIEIEEG